MLGFHGGSARRVSMGSSARCGPKALLLEQARQLVPGKFRQRHQGAIRRTQSTPLMSTGQLADDGGGDVRFAELLDNARGIFPGGGDEQAARADQAQRIQTQMPAHECAFGQYREAILIHAQPQVGGLGKLPQARGDATLGGIVQRVHPTGLQRQAGIRYPR